MYIYIYSDELTIPEYIIRGFMSDITAYQYWALNVSKADMDCVGAWKSSGDDLIIERNNLRGIRFSSTIVIPSKSVNITNTKEIMLAEPVSSPHNFGGAASANAIFDFISRDAIPSFCGLNYTLRAIWEIFTGAEGHAVQIEERVSTVNGTLTSGDSYNETYIYFPNGEYFSPCDVEPT